MISVFILLYLTSYSYQNKLQKYLNYAFVYYLSTNNVRNSFQSARIYETLFYGNYSSLRTNNQSYESSKVTCLTLLDYWYRSSYSSWTSFILVWHFLYCSPLGQISFTKPFFLCQYWQLEIICITALLWSSSRIRPWSSTLHLIHTPLSTLLSYLIRHQTITSMLMILILLLLWVQSVVWSTSYLANYVVIQK